MHNSDIDGRLDRIEHQLEVLINTRPLFPEQVLGGDEIDFHELWNIMWRGRFVIVIITFIFATVSVFYALSLPNIYKSEALLAPSEENSGGGLAGIANQFGGLASLAGINLRSGASDKTDLAIQILKSKDFAVYFVHKHQLLVELMASKGWDEESNQLIVDKKIYDLKEREWIRKPQGLRGSVPGNQEIYEKFSDILVVNKNKKSNFVEISVNHFSPYVSKNWLDWVIEDINQVVKERDVDEALKSVSYLNNQIQKTSVADMKSVFYQLIEEQTKIIMFAEIRDEYVFEIIDSPLLPEQKDSPSRALICIVSVIIGFFLSLVVIIANHFLFAKK